LVDDSIARMRAFLTSNKDELKHWTSFAIDIAKIFAVLAGPMGLYILISYLQSVRAPLPISDFSTIQTLIIIAAAYAFLIVVVMGIIYLPVFLCQPSRKTRMHIRIKTFNYSLRNRSWIEHLGSQPFLFQGSALVLIPTYSILWMSRASIGVSLLWLGGMLFLGAAASVAMFLGQGITPDRARHFRTKLALRVFTGSIVRGGWCIAWLRVMAMFNLAFPVVKDNQASSVGRIALWSMFMIVTLFAYFGLTSVRARVERVPILIFAGLFVALALYPTYFSRKTLHFLGIGGGIPIEILLRTMEPSGTSFIARSVRGCLILNAGSRIIFQPLDVPTSDACGRELPLQELGYDTMYKGIEVLSGSDIIKLSGFLSFRVPGQKN